VSKHLVEVGLSVIHGKGDEDAFDSQAKLMVAEALRPVNVKDLRVCGALLLATADWCKFPASISKNICHQLRETLGYEVHLFGASMAGFYCSTEPDPFVVNGLLLLLICSNDLWITVGHLAEPYSGSPSERRERLKGMADELVEKAGVKLGASADKSLFGFLPGIITDSRYGRSYFDNELHQEILEAFNYRYQLVGAAAADGVDPNAGYQFANDVCLRSGVALALIESDINTAAMMTHGLKPYKGVRVSVDGVEGGAESGYKITLLDGHPAAQRLHELRGEGMTTLENPVFGLPCGPDFNIIWPHKKSDEGGESIRLARRVARGDRLYVLNGAPKDMLAAAAKALEGMLERSGAKVGDLSLIVGFSCVGRVRNYAAQGHDWRNIINQLREDYLGVPLVWALSTGEFGVDEWQRARANNMSISVTCLTNNYSRRARIRKLQDTLLNAASRLNTCDSPRSVMEVALTEVVKTGGTGGQICIVDNRLHRIVGKDFGFALQARHSSHDWPKVTELTDRPAPAKLGGHFPAYLKEWALPVTPDINKRIESSTAPVGEHGDGSREDLLTLIVRTLHAVNVTDSEDPRFHCNKHAVAAGNLKRQIAIPLVGSQGRAIATLQVSFPDQQSVDRESLVLWISYAQKVAAALERASEAQERDVQSKITKLADAIKSSPQTLSLYGWCEEFMRKVVELLGADGGHIRLQEPSDPDKHFLATTVGLLANILPLTRKVISEGDGSYNRHLLNSDGWISNLKEETRSYLKNVKAVDDTEPYAAALERELNKIEALAVIPIYDQGIVIGSFDVYSKRQYFFNERRERIARAAAMQAGDILRVKAGDNERLRAELDREFNDRERDWILDSLTVATEGRAEERLYVLLERLCHKVKANVGAVFVWYEEAQKLILRKSFGWHKPLDGTAFYERDEGWTGRVAFSKEDVIIMSPTSTKNDPGTKKYYDSMVPPEHRVAPASSHARIGLRLTAGKSLIGFVMLSYYWDNAQYLIHNDKNITNFLKAVRNLITLAVEAVDQEAKKKQMVNLAETRSEIAKRLINTAGSDEGWQSVLDTIREGFSVERVTFYHVRPDKHYQVGWSSQATPCASRVEPAEPREPMGALTDIVLRGKQVSINSPSDKKFVGWPNRTGIKSVFAIPVIGARGDVRGVLEFVNRTATPDHPFEFFDVMEKSMAWNVATPLAAALERHEYDKAVSELSSKLVTAAKIGARGLMGAIVMHQVMGAFARMRGVLDWLKLNPDSSTAEREIQLNRIEVAYSQAVQTIRQTANRGLPGLQRVNLRNLIQQTLRVMEPELPVSGVRKYVDNKLNVFVEVDLWAMVGALVNIISNALDAMNGSGDLTISTELSADKGNAVIRIYNTGPRLGEDQIRHIFQPGVSTKSSDEHLGLGLPLAKQAVENAGGTLIMSSPERGGVEVVVELPVSDV
jgi:signal transduction histidine kinase